MLSNYLSSSHQQLHSYKLCIYKGQKAPFRIYVSFRIGMLSCTLGFNICRFCTNRCSILKRVYVSPATFRTRPRLHSSLVFAEKAVPLALISLCSDTFWFFVFTYSMLAISVHRSSQYKAFQTVTRGQDI